MTRNIKDILKANVCAFCEIIYAAESLDEDEFLESLNSFLIENDLERYLIEYTADVAYDIDDIDNICRDIEFYRKSFEFNEIIDYSRVAHYNTLNVDKTINVEAFVDNLIEEFRNLK